MVQHIVDFCDAMPSLPVLLLLAMVVGPPLVVVHELGHALMALWRTTGPVFVRIGARERRWALRAGRFSIEAGPSEIALAGGFCSYDPNGVSPASRALVAMGGPAASLAGAAVSAWLWGHTAGVVRDALCVATLGGIFFGVVNALPLTYRGKQDGAVHVARLDGLHALEALRELRPSRPAVSSPGAEFRSGPAAERWAHEVEDAARRARAQRAQANVARLRDRDAERRAGSVPPPR